MGCGSSAVPSKFSTAEECAVVAASAPTLCFRGAQDSANGRKWCFSVLLASNEGTTPELLVDGQAVSLSKIHVYEGTSLHRADVGIEMAQEERSVTYSVDGTARNIWIPAAGSTPNFLFSSCNGMTGSDCGAAKFAEKSSSAFNNTWDKVLERHHACHFHISIGGGDQLYCDDVLQLPQIAEWLKLFDTDRCSGLAADFTDDMRMSVKRFYFGRYLRHFHSSRNTSYAAAISVIPCANTWDDHDIFDGFGSYDDEIQSCNVMRGIFDCARECFCLFQLHMTFDERTQRGYFGGGQSLSTILTANHVAIIMVDLRSERGRTQIVSTATYSELKMRMLKLNCRFALCVLGLPILYPPHTSMHNIIDSMNPDGKNKLFTFLLKKLNTGLKQHGPFEGQPQLLDDLNDHWTCREHIHEQLHFLQLLHDVATTLPCPIAILSGDVHTSCVQELQTALEGLPLLVNIVSSGMRHSPMPSAVASVIKKLPCQTDLVLDEKRWNVVPQLWRKVSGVGPDFGSYFCQRNFTEISWAEEALTARLWLEVRHKNKDFSEYAYRFPWRFRSQQEASSSRP